ncbi:MAG: 4-hydroxythreonine-4-phosphate dehydrogenase PdxA [Candidatus Poribacteria bacterium]
MSHIRPIVIITVGDPAGIGPEIIYKALSSKSILEFKKKFTFLCIGARKPFDKLGAPIKEVTVNSIRKDTSINNDFKNHILLLPAPERTPNKSLLLEGFQSGWAIKKATSLLMNNFAIAMATAPISKERLNAGGFFYAGHTEFLAALCKSPDVTMMLANNLVRVSLVTTHAPIRKVPLMINPKKIEVSVKNTALCLKRWWNIKRPRIAITSLNPHGGEGGLFGNEEKTILLPTISRLRYENCKNYSLEGPFPADTLFANQLWDKKSTRYDAIVCMYHDQGLIPVKLLDFPNTVNVTLGLPIIRTSVDHGVAFDIAGKGRADPSSLIAAVRLAVHLGVLNKDKRGL